MSSPTITRRALIAGAGTAIASAALAVPALNAVRADEVCSLPVAPETITDRLDRLTQELSVAMAEYQGGKFKVVVEPTADGDVTFVRMEPEHILSHAAWEIRQAMADMGKDDFMVFVLDRPGQRASRYIDFKESGMNYREIA